METKMRYPEIEFQPLDVIKKYQEERLVETINYLNEKSPYYKRLFTDNHIDISKITTIESLQSIPFTEKNDLQKYNDDFLCVPKEKIVDYITTSGTTGEPVVFACSEKDLQRLAYNEKISF